MTGIKIYLLLFSGAALGYFLPELSEKIIAYKCRHKNRDPGYDARYTATFIKLGFCILNGYAWFLSGVLSGTLPAALLCSALMTTAVLIGVIDVRVRIVPNELVLVMLVCGTIFQVLQFGVMAILSSFFCLLVMAAVFTTVASFIGFDKVGAGDVKLAGAMGFALGYPDILTAMGVMAAGFLLFSLTGILLKRLTLKSMLPFAPFMMTGMVVALTYLIYRVGL